MKDTDYSVAMYLRLSRDDISSGDVYDTYAKDKRIHSGSVKSESNSIGSQREIVRTFIREHDNMELYDVYIDDGYTGSDFERPEFKRMMSDINAGKVNCVIVKDLSRFGRDYIEVGRLIQKTFPALSVRFVAITDNYDSSSADGADSSILLPIKNFINDYYCRDISMKVKSQQKIKRISGEFIGAFASYGYKKDDKDRNHLVVDEYAADIVRRIFSWKIYGLSSFTIAGRLNELGILAPLSYKKSNGDHFNTGFSGKSHNLWSSVAVKRILTNEVYLGNLIQGKTERLNYKVKKQIEKPESEWIRVEHTHEAIVSEDDFKSVQNLLKADMRVMNDTHEVTMFSGLLFCGDCNQQMIRRINRYKGNQRVYYICSTKNRGEGCSRHSIEEGRLTEIVFNCVMIYTNMFLSQEEVLRHSKRLESNFDKISCYDREIQRLREEQEKYYRIDSGLFEDLRTGVLTKHEFEKLQAAYKYRIDALSAALMKQEEFIKRLFKKGIASGAKLEEIKKSVELTELDRHTLACLVRKVKVFEERRIEIEFNFSDEYNAAENLNRFKLKEELKEKRRI